MRDAPPAFSPAPPPPALSPDELADFRRLAGIMVPASAEYRVPGADDGTIFNDIARSIGRDRDQVRQALAMLRVSAGGPFTALDEVRAQATAMAFLSRQTREISTLGRVVLQCYYRDDRVFRSLGREPRAPFPKGHEMPATDWSLLDPVRGRPRMWRDVGEKSATDAEGR